MKSAYLRMIRELDGGWEAMVAALDMKSRTALENRIYERQGQGVLVRTALQMQYLAKSTAFAETVAKASGGYFLQFPTSNVGGREDLLQKFNTLYTELGQLSSVFQDAIEDDEVSLREKDDLSNAGQRIHKTVQELLVLTFLIYCRQE